MNRHEKSTYLVFRDGRDPEKLKLGNLVISPKNPLDDDHYTCPYNLSDLHQWTDNPQTQSCLSITVQDSRARQASLNAACCIEAARGSVDTSYIHIEGSNARRFQIEHTTEFLNRMIMSSPGAKAWLNSRITVAKHMYYLNQLKFGSSRRPQIWMVTGVQLLSDVTVRYRRESSSSRDLNFRVPPPEAGTLAANFILANDNMAIGGASLSLSTSSANDVAYSHVDERVWAAQFRRLNVDFRKEGAAFDRRISLKDLLDLGHLGIRGAVTQGVDEASQITGVDEDDANERSVGIEETDKELFKKILSASASGKRALLIGGAESNLKGVRNDLRGMSDLLLDLGFDVSLCFEKMATRDGILRSWAQLIQKTRNGDTVVVYYSGHGGISKPNRSDADRNIQYILPIDIVESTKDDFRGILDVELSYLVSCLTDRTHNVTIVLDCCHSERAVRAGIAGLPLTGVRAWSPVSRKEIESHMHRVTESGVLEKLKYREANPYSVRIAAAEDNQYAYEDTERRQPETQDTASYEEEFAMGRLTRELVMVIRKIGDDITSWDAVLSQLRDKLYDAGDKSQRPQIEGPKMRILFSLERLAYYGQLGVKSTLGRKDKLISAAYHKDEASLMGGRLVGIREGDQYAIMPSTANSVDEAKKIAVAEVKAVYTTSCEVRLKFVNGFGEVKQGATAFPVRCFRPEYGVQISVNNAFIDSLLRAQIDSAMFVHVANLGDGDEGGYVPFATVKEEGGKLVLLHQHNDPIFAYPAHTEAEYGDAVDNVVYQLQKLARAHQVLNMVPGEMYDLDVSQVSIEVGRVERKRRRPFSDGEMSFNEGDLAYLEIRNGSNTSIFAHVFLVTSMGTINWLSNGSPSGEELHRNGRPYIPGQPAFGARRILSGWRFNWPTSIPRRGPLKEAFVVILTSEKADLGFLETEYRKGARAKVGAREWDENEQIAEVCVDDDFFFSVRRIDFDLVPRLK
ncbi:Metacaspase-1 [Cytospora mali]|uniref:Metacaspase-1 n=1 Tax=Cytospora mali TaxID=578113 RepID=A0A194W8P2_CYTMA|nr:Metacaspase-1 [Valsa mali]